MKHWKIMIQLFVLLLLFGGSASAAKLTVVLVGTGYGAVDGEDIFCGSHCSATYEKKSVAQLEAEAYDDSTFEGFFNQLLKKKFFSGPLAPSGCGRCSGGRRRAFVRGLHWLVKPLTILTVPFFCRNSAGSDWEISRCGAAMWAGRCTGDLGQLQCAENTFYCT